MKASEIIRRVLSATAASGVICGLLLASNAGAADKTWTGGGEDPMWQNGGNWSGGTPPVEGDHLLFSGVQGLSNTNNFVAGTLFDGITFVAPAGAFGLDGARIVLGGGGIVNNQVVTPQAINLPIELGSTRTVSVTDTGRLGLGGVISGPGGIAKTGGEN